MDGPTLPQAPAHDRRARLGAAHDHPRIPLKTLDLARLHENKKLAARIELRLARFPEGRALGSGG